MPSTRRNRVKAEDKLISNTDSSPDESPTSSQPLQQTSSKRASPFRGFDGNVDKTNLDVMNRILKIEGGDDGLNDDESMPRTTPKESNTENISNTNASLSRPSTSGLPLQPTTSRRRVSHRTELADNGLRDEDSQSTLKEVKRKMSDSPTRRIKQIKTAKTRASKCEKENHINMMKNILAKGSINKKNKLDQPNPKGKQIYCDDQGFNESENKNSNFSFGFGTKGGNFVKIFNNLQRGLCKPSVFEEVAEQVTLKSLKWFNVFVKHQITDLRVTAMAWHPTNSHLLVSGGKAGGLVFYMVDEENTFDPLIELRKFPGIGPGGTMEGIRFCKTNCCVEVCTASVDGTIALYNFDKFIRKSLVMSSDPYRLWFCAVDIHQDGKSVYGADCMGNLAIHHLDSGKTDYQSKAHKLHKSKIRHLEFSTRDPNLMVTSSLDKTVKLWDIRKLDGSKSSIESLEHTTAISTAKFSRTDGCRLLTTDQNSELRVYKAPGWHLEHSISHPHRHFQHLTLIRASWHPQADFFAIGRYPDPKLESSFDDLRSVDVYSASSAKLCHELTDTSKLITSLVEFNSSGSFLASSSGRTIHLWKQKKRKGQNMNSINGL